VYRRGIVVALIGEGEFFAGFCAEDWAHLGKGALVDYDKVGLVHYDVIEQDVELVGRAQR
jgi:hypothetical protein